MSAIEPIIDVHTHYVPRKWPDLSVGAEDPSGWPWMRIDSEADAMIMVGSEEFRKVQNNCWSAQARLADMDRDGISMQVVSPTPVFFGYTRTPADASRTARIFNDLALEICAPARDRLLPFCQVPLQDPDAACAEVDRCIANGHVGVEIGNHVGDRDLDDEGIVTFLQHCAQAGVPVFVHPWDMQKMPRNQRWMSQWLTGMPAETHMSLLAMILGGVFDRIPDSLRICFAHGGGSFAFWLGRMENAWHQRYDVIGTSAMPPSHYLRRFYVDSVVFSDPALRLLVDVLGADRVMVGSDYPYPLGERPAGAAVRASQLLDERERRMVLHSNAREFLGIPAVEASPAPTAAGASA